MLARSSGRILHLGATQHLCAEMFAQVLDCSQIDPTPAQKCGEAGLDPGKANQAGFLPMDKLHEKIDVAVSPRSSFEDRTEEGEAANVVPSAEVGECVAIKRQVSVHVGSFVTAARQQRHLTQFRISSWTPIVQQLCSGAIP